MGYGNRSGGDDIEILGKISKIMPSPSGGKRLEVEATFKPKIEVEQTHLPAFLQRSSSHKNSDQPQKINIDMNSAEAGKLKENDEIRARIQEKYKSNRFGGGRSGFSNIYTHIETLQSSPGSTKGGGPWNRFKS